MKIIPVFTEKSLAQAKDGFYSFWVGSGMGKSEIKRAIEKLFGVHVTRVRTINFKARARRNLRGRTVSEPAKKKAVISLKGDEKIDLFEIKEKKG